MPYTETLRWVAHVMRADVGGETLCIFNSV